MRPRKLLATALAVCAASSISAQEFGVLGSARAQSATSCRHEYTEFDRVIADNLDALRRNPNDPGAFASINAFMASMLAKEPKREIIEGPFAPGTQAQKIGMICQGQPDLTYKCTYLFSIKFWRVRYREFGAIDTWLLQFKVVNTRYNTSAQLMRVEQLGAMTAPTICS